MSEGTKKLALAYFDAINAKDARAYADMLADNMHLITPLADIRGKDEVAKNTDG